MYVLIVAVSVSIAFWNDHRNNVANRRFDRIARTSYTLCSAAAGARDYWIKRRTATVYALTDPGLSVTAQESLQLEIAALDEVIRAAGGVARSCDNQP